MVASSRPSTSKTRSAQEGMRVMDEIHKAARLSVEQMQSHLDELAAETGVRLDGSFLG
jgi:hypothetical protein